MCVDCGVAVDTAPLLFGHQALQVLPALAQLLAHDLVPPHLCPQLDGKDRSQTDRERERERPIREIRLSTKHREAQLQPELSNINGLVSARSPEESNQRNESNLKL